MGSTESRARGRLRRAVARFNIGEDLVLTVVPYVLLLALMTSLAILQPQSLSTVHIARIVNISMPLMLVAIGQLIVTLTGGMDLSVGGVFSLTSAIVTASGAWGLPIGPVVIVVCLLGWLPGLVNGILIVYARVKPFIVTLATWFVYGGLALTVLREAGGSIDKSLGLLSTGKIAGVGASIWVITGIALFGVWFLRTRVGLEIKSIGSNREAAFHSGVNVKRVEVIAYCLASLFAVLGGVFFSSQVLSGDPTIGDGYILASFAVVAVGGTRLSGGWGNITGTVVGALVLSYLLSVNYALHLATQWVQILQGLLLIFSVAIQSAIRWLFRRGKEL